MDREVLQNIIVNRGYTLYQKFRPEKCPERSLHKKPWSKMTIWEKRVHNKKNGENIPFESFVDGDFPHYEERDRILERSIRLGIVSRVFHFLNR